MAENLNTLYYALGLDDHEMQDGLKKAIQNLSVLDDEFNRINKSIEETFGKKIKNTPIHNEVKGLKGELQALEKQWNALTLAQKRGVEGQELRAKYEALRKEAGNLNNSLARLYTESQKASSGQKGLAAQFGLVNKELTLQSRLMSNVNTLFTTYVSIFAVKSFIQNLARVRGEFENQQIALRAILRDAEAADRIFGQIKSFAVVSPFEFKDLVGYAKQLSAFQVPVNELFETTKRLADVSAGLGVGMDRIILAYGQVRSAAVLRGQELRQFTEAGIPLVDELAKKFSELEGRVVSAGDVFEKISNRMVSFEMVKEIFEDMTNEGGMFYMMQEKQAESLKGKIANLADAYDIMLNDIGQANDGIFKGGVEGIAALMNNWEKVWSILKTIIISYGAYKAAVIALIAVEKSHIAINTAGNLALTAKNLGIVISNLGRFQAALRMTGLSAKAFHIAIGGIIGVLSAVGIGIYEIIQNSNKLSNELNKISNDEFSGFKRMSDSLENLSDRLKNTIQGSQEHRDIIRQINNEYGEYLPFILNEKTALDAVANSTEQVIEAMKKRKMMMAQEKGEQAIQNEYGSDLAETRKNTLDFLEKLNIAKEDAVNIVRILEEKIKQTSGSASIEELYDEVKQYLGEDIFKNSAYSVADLDLRLKYLAKTIVNIKNAESDLATQNSITWETSFDTKKARLEFEKLESYYVQLREELKKKPLDKDQFDKELAEIDKQEKIAKINFKVEFEGLSAEKAKEQIKALEEISVKWKEIVKETIGKNKAGFVFKVSEGESQFDYLDRLDKEYKKIKAQQDLINKGLVTSPETIESTKTQLSLLEQIGKALNYNFKVDVKAEKKTESPRIQLLNKELALIEKAKNDYDKLIKWQSKLDANQNIKAIYGIDFNEKDVESRAKDIISKITSISKTEGEKAQKSFDKWFAGDQTSKIVDNLKKTFDAITKEIDSYKNKYDLYKHLFNLTGNEQLSIELSFGVDFEGIPNLSTYLADQIKEIASTKFGIVLNFDIENKNSIQAQLGDIYKNLSSILKKQIDELDKIRQNDAKDTAELYAKNIAELGNMEQRRLAIVTKYEKEIQAARKMSDEGIAQKLEGKRDLELMQLTEDYVGFFSWIEAMSRDVASNIHTALRNQLNEMLQAGKITIEEYAKAVESIDAQMAKKINEKSFGQTYTSEGLSGMISKFQSLGKSMELKGANKGDQKMQQFGKNMQAGAQKAMGAMQVVDQIVTNIHNGIVATQELINSINEFRDSKGLDELKGSEYFQVLSEFDKHAAAGWDKLKSGDIAGAASETIQSYISIFTSLNKLHDKKLDKTIKDSERAVRDLQWAYEDLERTVSKALGEDRYKYTGQQLKNLQTQQAEIAKQAQAERDKKKTDKDKVAELEQQYKELGYTIEDLIINIRDEIIGGTAVDVAQQLGDAFFDAFMAGENYAEAWHDKVKDIIGDIVKRMVTQKFLEQPIANIIEKYGKQWNLEAGGDVPGRVIDSLDNFYGELDDLINTAGPSMEAIFERFKDLFAQTGGQGEGLVKGVQSLTEPTGQLLASYINAIRASEALQELYMENIDANVAGIYEAMGGNMNITTTTSMPPELIASISEPLKLNNSLLTSIDANMANVHSIAANSLAQLVMIQSNTLNTANATREAVEELRGVIFPGHPKGGNGIKVWDSI